MKYRLPLILLSSLIITIIAWMADRYSIGLEQGTYTISSGFILNAIPLLLINLILLSLFNRIFIATVFSITITVSFYLINKSIVEHLLRVFSISDLLLINSLNTETIQLFLGYIDRTYLSIGLFALVIFLILAFTLEKPIVSRSRLLIRIYGITLPLYILYAMTQPASWLTAFYSEEALGIAWTNEQSSVHSGVIGNLVYRSLERKVYEHKDINIEAAQSVIKDAKISAPPAIADTTKPDIILIQSESFFDPTTLTELNEAQKLTPNLVALRQSAQNGYMQVPAFGGGTLRTEFEVLSAIPLAAYPEIDYPYLQLIGKKIPTLASVLRDNGYLTTAIHGNAGTFWNRNDTFKNFGFNEFITLKDFPEGSQNDGWFMSDRSMTDVIISKLESASAPVFTFAISMEAHGSYSESPVAHKDAWSSISVPESLSEGGKTELKNYLYHIQNADRELGRLKAYLDKRGKPYILGFYGDHLPGFQEVYQNVSFTDGQTATNQKVPWLLISNTGNSDNFSVKSAWMLGASILGSAHIHDDGYFDIVNQMTINGSPLSATRAPSDIYNIAYLQMEGTLDKFTNGDSQ